MHDPRARSCAPARGLVAGATLFALLAPAAPAAPFAPVDRVVTVDGRVLKPLKAREEGAGLRLVFEHGEIVLLDRALVKAVEIEGDMSDYVPADERERKFLEDGYVRYQGRWMSKASYEDELQKEFEASRARTEEVARHAEFRNGWRAETKHFEVRTNTSPELLQYYCDLLEAHYSQMDDRFGIKLSPAMRRMKMIVNVYKNRKEFHKLNAAGLGGSVAGYFSSSSLDLNFYHDYAEPSISDWVCLHEGTHLLTFLIDPDYVAQIWINEAVADFFGSAEIVVDGRGRVEITSGKLQTDRVLTVQQALRDGNAIGLEQLFRITREEFHSFQYAHAWSFVYFLNESKQYKKGFDKFFKDLYTLKKGIEFEVIDYPNQSGRGKRVPPEEIRRVLLEALKVKDVEKLEAEWHEFIAQVPVAGPEARFKRGYRGVMFGAMFDKDREKQSRNMNETREDLDFAIQNDFGGARAHFARARLLMLMGKPADALGDFERAVELDPLSGNYRFALGEALCKGDPDRATAAEAPEAAVQFALAAALEPLNEEYRRFHERFSGS